MEINRAGSLVDILTGRIYPLAHGDNIIGRENTVQNDKDCKIPLRIPQTEVNISRVQASINVANNTDGTLISITTSRNAKNATRILGNDRFGTSRGRISVKPGEKLKLSKGDIIELDSIESKNSYAWRLEVTGDVSSAPLSFEASEAHFEAFGKTSGDVSDDTMDDENSDEELIEQIRKAEQDPAKLQLSTPSLWDEVSGDFVSILHEGMSVFGVVESKYDIQNSSSGGGDRGIRPPIVVEEAPSAFSGISETWSEFWSSWSRPSPPAILDNTQESSRGDVESLEVKRAKRAMVIHIQALIRGYLSRKSARQMWELAAGELARRLKKRLGRGQEVVVEPTAGGAPKPAIIWIRDVFNETVLDITGVKTEFKSLDLSKLAFAHAKGLQISIKFIGRKQLKFKLRNEEEAAIFAASLEFISVWCQGATKPRNDQQRTTQFLILLEFCPKWLLKRKGKTFASEDAIVL